MGDSIRPSIVIYICTDTECALAPISKQRAQPTPAYYGADFLDICTRMVGRRLFKPGPGRHEPPSAQQAAHCRMLLIYLVAEARGLQRPLTLYRRAHACKGLDAQARIHQ